MDVLALIAEHGLSVLFPSLGCWFLWKENQRIQTEYQRKLDQVIEAHLTQTSAWVEAASSAINAVSASLNDRKGSPNDAA